MKRLILILGGLFLLSLCFLPRLASTSWGVRSLAIHLPDGAHIERLSLRWWGPQRVEGLIYEDGPFIVKARSASINHSLFALLFGKQVSSLGCDGGSLTFEGAPVYTDIALQLGADGSFSLEGKSEETPFTATANGTGIRVEAPSISIPPLDSLLARFTAFTKGDLLALCGSHLSASLDLKVTHEATSGELHLASRELTFNATCERESETGESHIVGKATGRSGFSADIDALVNRGSSHSLITAADISIRRFPLDLPWLGSEGNASISVEGDRLRCSFDTDLLQLDEAHFVIGESITLEDRATARYTLPFGTEPLAVELTSFTLPLNQPKKASLSVTAHTSSPISLGEGRRVSGRATLSGPSLDALSIEGEGALQLSEKAVPFAASGLLDATQRRLTGAQITVDTDIHFEGEGRQKGDEIAFSLSSHSVPLCKRVAVVGRTSDAGSHAEITASSEGKVLRASWTPDGVSVEATDFPTAPLEELTTRYTTYREVSTRRLLGDIFTITLEAKDSIAFQLDSPRLTASAQGHIEEGLLMLDTPIRATYAMTSETLSRLLGNEALAFTAGLHPLSLYIDPEGAAIPLSRPSYATLPYLSLICGDVELSSGKALGTLGELLECIADRPLSLRVAPCEATLEKGVLTLRRTEFLVDNRHRLALWGSYQLERKKELNLTLGITAPVLESIFGVGTPSPDYVLQVPIKNRGGSVQIGTEAAKRTIALMLTKRIGKKLTGGNKAPWSELVSAVGTLTDDQSRVPPPRTPFPWDIELEEQ
jgi:hypothetical protein